jgi:hypothetical protein
VRGRGGALVAAVGLFQLPESEERHEGGRLRGGSCSGPLCDTLVLMCHRASNITAKKQSILH